MGKEEFQESDPQKDPFASAGTSKPPSLRTQTLNNDSTLTSSALPRTDYSEAELSPISTKPNPRVTIRSERSLRNTLHSSTRSNSLIAGERPPPLSLLQCLKVIILSTWLNVLLVFVPLGIIADKVGWSPIIVFVFNFIAIVPLAKLLGFATEEISLRLGEVRKVPKQNKKKSNPYRKQ